jgi:hypothetical protein
MLALKAIQDYLKDKSVILIARGQPDTSKYDVVIRMNLGITDGKADVWVNHLVPKNYVGWEYNKNDFKYVLRLNAERGDSTLIKGFPEALNYKTYFWNKKDHDRLALRNTTYLRPFTGTTTISWLLEYTKPKKLDVFGMTFYKNLPPGSPVHLPHLDRGYVERMSEEVDYFTLLNTADTYPDLLKL